MNPPPVSIRLPLPLKTQLKAIAQQRGLSAHGAMLLAIREFISAQSKTPAA